MSKNKDNKNKKDIREYLDLDITKYNDHIELVINEILDIINEIIRNKNFYEKRTELNTIIDNLYKCIKIGNSLNIKAISRRLDNINTFIETKKETNNELENSFIDSIIKRILVIKDTLENKENKKFEFIIFLIQEENIDLLSELLDKIPSIIKTKNKDNISILRYTMNKYVNSVIEDNIDSSNYYHVLLLIMMSANNFKLSKNELSECEADIDKYISKLKSSKKKNKEKIESIEILYKIIGSRNKLKNESDDIVSKYGLSTDFSTNNIEQIHEIKIPLNPNDYPDRELIDDYIITIDKEGAIEVDDGISCKKLPNGNYLLGVHIASVLGYFDYDSDIVQEAIERGHTIYLPKNTKVDETSVIPSFPLEFSGQLASLLPNDYKLTRSYYFEIDKLGNIVNKEFKKTIIKSSKKTSYKELNKEIKEDIKNPNLKELVENLDQVINILERKFIPIDADKSEKYVYYSMLLTNSEVAKFFYDNNYPCAYRTLELDKKTYNELELLKEFYQEKVFKKIYDLMEDINPKGKYASSGKHDGLNLKNYCHCTSVLRRPIDILIEHALEVCYDKTPTLDELIELEAEIERVIDITNEKNRNIDLFVREMSILSKRLKN